MDSSSRRLTAAAAASAAAVLMVSIPAPRLAAWGAHGHELAARAAATELPDALPSFFRDAAAQLEYLNPEPDRWRRDESTEMNQAFAYDHYIDLENVPDGALDAPDRWLYLQRLYEAGLEVPHRDAGFLPYRIVELHQRLVEGFRRWRNAPARERPWIEERIIHDAGILGHYVTDASQPHHTTIHFNGWAADAPNPEGFTTDRGFHARFESRFVRAHIRLEHLLREMDGGEPERIENVRVAVMDHILEAHRKVPTLYRLDRDRGFDASKSDPETVAFAVERLVSGAEMLRRLWWSAWLESAEAPR